MSIAAAAALAAPERPLWASIRPLRDFAVIRLAETIQRPSGIVLLASEGTVTSQEQRGHMGTVISVGPGRYEKKRDVAGAWHGEYKSRFIPTSIKPGDVVMFGEFDFPRWTEDGMTWMLIQEADITGVETQAEAA
jgi:co-chaperonin GroES (HSP10)